jgi:hypothetical protein
LAFTNTLPLDTLDLVHATEERQDRMAEMHGEFSESTSLKRHALGELTGLETH